MYYPLFVFWNVKDLIKIAFFREKLIMKWRFVKDTSQKQLTKSLSTQFICKMSVVYIRVTVIDTRLRLCFSIEKKNQICTFWPLVFMKHSKNCKLDYFFFKFLLKLRIKSICDQGWGVEASCFSILTEG